MIGDIITCDNVGCNEVFAKKTHNQLYHDDECCRLATNAKIMAKYYKRRAQQLGLKRECSVCNTKLSRYNSEDTCAPCSLKQETVRNQSVVSMLSTVSWQS